MRIAQVCPLVERVPPPGYGGIELVVSLLTDELVTRGHDVTLFASGDSITKAKLSSVVDKSIRNNQNVSDPIVYRLLQINQVLEQENNFDIIHFHLGYFVLPFIKLLNSPVVHTSHGTITEENRKLFLKYSQECFISISNAQRQLKTILNYVSTVYNGIDIEKYPFAEKPSNPPYLAFLGRMDSQKGVHHAIKISQKTGLPLKMAGKKQDVKYFSREVEPYLDGKQIQYLGEVTHEEKAELLRNAAVTLFPITWAEPFGLVMIESMCTGTPVIAMNFGSVPEVIEHGKTGFICNNIDEMMAAIPKALKLNRQDCHDHVVNKFSVKTMVDDYEAVYSKIIKQK
jgi:glycosyltransferase involved in cell wall biosynthesis